MKAQDKLRLKYGPPRHEGIVKYCVTWHIQLDFPWFPAKTFLINNDFKAVLYVAFKALEAAGVHTEIKTYDGCYNDRPVRGTNTEASLHSWACAIDLNAKENPMIPNAQNLTPQQRLGAWSAVFVQIMKSSGVFFGGDFHSRADSMHWALLDG